MQLNPVEHKMVVSAGQIRQRLLIGKGEITPPKMATMNTMSATDAVKVGLQFGTNVLSTERHILCLKEP